MEALGKDSSFRPEETSGVILEMKREEPGGE